MAIKIKSIFKKKSNKNRDNVLFSLLLTGSITIICVTFLALFFYNHFENQELSTNIEQWGQFGDFFGGILNPFISLVSLGILGYLTYIVNKESSSEDRKNKDLDKRREGYDALASYAPGLNKSTMFLLTKINKLKEDYNRVENMGWDRFYNDLFILDTYKIYSEFEYYHDFYCFLVGFKIRYGLYFKYDFSSTDFKTLIEKAKYLNDIFLYFEKTLRNKQEIPKVGDLYIDIVRYYVNVTKALEQEILRTN